MVIKTEEKAATLASEVYEPKCPLANPFCNGMPWGGLGICPDSGNCALIVIALSLQSISKYGIKTVNKGG